ncbi:MAG: hypothetical protein K0R13_1707 [Propionibacteriaceae bacterium]|jgi:hypothetical protein|nr:hypothetical protein [Propionibacteriaceae bacterium]
MPGSDGELTAPARTIRSADRRRRAGWGILAAVEVLVAGAVLRFVAAARKSKTTSMGRSK